MCYHTEDAGNNFQRDAGYDMLLGNEINFTFHGQNLTK